MKSTILKILSKLKFIFLPMLTLLGDIQHFLMIIIIATIIDTGVGIYAVFKNKEEFRSGKLFNIVPKIFLYSSTIVLSFMVDTHILEGTLWGIENLLTKSSSILWLFIEIKSIDENSQKIGNKPVLEIISNLFSVVKKIKKDLTESK